MNALSLVHKTLPEGWRFIRNTKFWLLTERTSGGLRYQHAVILRFGRRRRSVRVARVVVLGRMGIGPLDLDEALGADGLIAASSHVQVRRVVEKADRTLAGVFVEESFEPLAIHVGVLGQHALLTCHISLRIVFRRGCQGSKCLGTTTEKGR